MLSAIVPLFLTARQAIQGYSILVYLNCMLPVGALIEGFQRVQFFETHGKYAKVRVESAYRSLN